MYWLEAIQKGAEVAGTGWTIVPWPFGLDGPYDDVTGQAPEAISRSGHCVLRAALLHRSVFFALV